MVICSSAVRCAIIIADWTLILITVPTYFFVVLALFRDVRRPNATKIFNTTFLTIVFYIVGWDVVSVYDVTELYLVYFFCRFV